MKVLNEARRVLRNPQERAKYDAALQGQESAAEPWRKQHLEILERQLQRAVQNYQKWSDRLPGTGVERIEAKIGALKEQIASLLGVSVAEFERGRGASFEQLIREQKTKNLEGKLGKAESFYVDYEDRRDIAEESLRLMELLKRQIADLKGISLEDLERARGPLLEKLRREKLRVEVPRRLDSLEVQIRQLQSEVQSISKELRSIFNRFFNRHEKKWLEDSLRKTQKELEKLRAERATLREIANKLRL